MGLSRGSFRRDRGSQDFSQSPTNVGVKSEVGWGWGGRNSCPLETVAQGQRSPKGYLQACLGEAMVQVTLMEVDPVPQLVGQRPLLVSLTVGP